MRSNIKITILLIFGFCLAVSSISMVNKFTTNNENNGMNVEDDDNISLKNPKQSGYWNNFSFIYINDNWSTAAGFAWCSGDGSWDKPYTLENLTIDATSSPTGSGIFINNSRNDYFRINNCTVFNTSAGLYNAGIKLVNTNNGTLIDNNCSNNGRNGIVLYQGCNNNTITGNTVNNNTRYGIYLRNECDNNTISGNTASNVGSTNQDIGIYLRDDCDNNTILGNTANNNTSHGIYLDNGCDNNSISGNTANNNVIHGMRISNCLNVELSGNQMIGCGLIVEGLLTQQSSHAIDATNTVNGKNIYYYVNKNDLDATDFTGAGQVILINCNNSDISNLDVSYTSIGIYLCNSDNNNISGNTANNNNQYGIYLYSGCDNNTITGNTANNNNQFGIYLYSGCDNNTITGNNASNVGSDNQDYGIYLYSGCDNNSISGNTANNNTRYGIHLYYGCDNNNISGNTVNNNVNAGIYLWTNCDDNTISGNTANNNTEYGISLRSECDNNNISGNTANNNTEYGIYLQTSCDDNTISGNDADFNGDAGISLLDSNYNTIYNNTAKNNTYGFRLEDSSYNCIYENILVNNTIQDYIEIGTCVGNRDCRFPLDSGEDEDDDESSGGAIPLGVYFLIFIGFGVIYIFFTKKRHLSKL